MKELNFFVEQYKNDRLPLPEKIVLVASNRTFNESIDNLDCFGEDYTHKLDELVNKYKNLLTDQITESHIIMALVELEKEHDQENLLNKSIKIELNHTYNLKYYPQVINEDGNYELNEIEEKSGRANTEATAKSAYQHLLANASSSTQNISIISNQPHIDCQLKAWQRVLGDTATINAAGPSINDNLTDLEQKKLILDSIKKTVQLLNPTYYVTTNQTHPPLQVTLTYSHGEWKKNEESHETNCTFDVINV